MKFCKINTKKQNKKKNPARWCFTVFLRAMYENGDESKRKKNDDI